MKGTFITFEGPEGSGKTTVARMVLESLNEEGYEVLYTREPGGIDIAEQIRKVILDPKNTAMDAKTEALLYAASRRQHLIEKVLPALEKGTVVICDRFVDSSLVYQGVARGLGIEAVYQMNLFAIEDVMPDATIFFDVAPEIGLQRIAENAHREVNRLDLEKLDMHQRVRQGYLRLAEQEKDRIVTIDASRDLDSVVEEVYQVILQHLA